MNDGGAGLVGWGDSMQIVGPLGNASEAYSYWDPSMDPNGEATTRYWGNDACEPVDVSFDEGEGIAIDNMNEYEYTIVGAGEVSTNLVSFAAHENFNWSGNPFPMTISLNSIQLDDGDAGTVGWGDSLQIVGPLGNASEAYSYWDASMDPNGEATTRFWGNDACEPVDVTLAPGAGFAIDNMNGLTFDITIECK